jgi:hypothetical protein
LHADFFWTDFGVFKKFETFGLADENWTGLVYSVVNAWFWYIWTDLVNAWLWYVWTDFGLWCGKCMVLVCMVLVKAWF